MSGVAGAVAHVRPARKVRARFSKAAGARDTIASFGHGMDVAGLTFGQFSLIDLIQAALEITGPADVVISTWSAGFYDVDAAKRFRDDGLLRSIRFVMDAASMKTGQASVHDVAGLFGADAIRSTWTHAKFALIRNDDWAVVITSSMNLNLNARCEQFEMTDDAERCAMFAGFVDVLFLGVEIRFTHRAGAQGGSDEERVNVTLMVGHIDARAGNRKLVAPANGKTEKNASE